MIIIITYGPTIENLNIIIDKARTKKDGTYLFRGMAYKVVNNRFTHYAYNGEVVEYCGNFVVVIGYYSGYSDAAKKALQTIKYC